MTTAPLILTDRSRIVKDWLCPRARYWNYEHEGRGIVSDGVALELWLGTAIHTGTARIAMAHQAGERPDIDVIASEAGREVFNSLYAATAGELDREALYFAHEQATLVEGIVRGFFRYQWPRLIAGRRILFVEDEMLLGLPRGIGFMGKPDLITESLEDGEWEYIEYKSTSSKKQAWIDSWATAVQLHSTIKAVGASKGREPSRVIIQGLYKGYESYGKQNSPFCYAYVRPGQPPFQNEAVRYDYAYGYKRQPVWERPGGVAAWIAGMPDEILVDQFPQSPPIFVKDILVSAFFRQTTIRENDIAEAMRELRSGALRPASADEILDAAFPQHFDQCTPSWGRGCSYKRLCHGVPDMDDSGLPRMYQWREPHHQPELELFGQQENEHERA